MQFGEHAVIQEAGDHTQNLIDHIESEKWGFAHSIPRNITPMWNQENYKLCNVMSLSDLVSHYFWLEEGIEFIVSPQETIEWATPYTKGGVALARMLADGVHSVLEYPTILMRRPNPKKLTFRQTMQIPFAYKVVARNQYTLRKCQLTILRMLNGWYGTPLPVAILYYVRDGDGYDEWEHFHPPYNSTNRLGEVLKDEVGHGSLVLGYNMDGPDGPYFEIKNSHDDDWGDMGYGQITINSVRAVYFVTKESLGPDWEHYRVMPKT